MNDILIAILLTQILGTALIIMALRRNKMANKADLDVALDAFKAALAAQIAKVLAAFKRLEDLVAAGGTGPDLQAEIDSIKTDLTAQIDTLGAKADTEGQPTPPAV